MLQQGPVFLQQAAKQPVDGKAGGLHGLPLKIQPGVGEHFAHHPIHPLRLADNARKVSRMLCGRNALLHQLAVAADNAKRRFHLMGKRVGEIPLALRRPPLRPGNRPEFAGQQRNEDAEMEEKQRHQFPAMLLQCIIQWVGNHIDGEIEGGLILSRQPETIEQPILILNLIFAPADAILRKIRKLSRTVFWMLLLRHVKCFLKTAHCMLESTARGRPYRVKALVAQKIILQIPAELHRLRSLQPFRR